MGKGGLTKDPKVALTYFQKSAALGDQLAMDNIAKILRRRTWRLAQR